jgi:hypothetical protein
MRVIALFLLATLVPLVPFLFWLARRTAHPTRADVADTLEAFLNGTGRQHDWDAFLALPLSDPQLDAVRTRCGHLPVQFPPQQPGQYCSDAGLQTIRSLISELRQGSPAAKQS